MVHVIELLLVEAQKKSNSEAMAKLSFTDIHKDAKILIGKKKIQNGSQKHVLPLFLVSKTLLSISQMLPISPIMKCHMKMLQK